MFYLTLLRCKKKCLGSKVALKAQVSVFFSSDITHILLLCAMFWFYAEWEIPLVAKRLDARYDWLMGHWGQKSFNLVGAGDGCKPSPAVAGAVAWLSEGNCSFFTKVRWKHVIQLMINWLEMFSFSFFSDIFWICMFIT